VKDFTISKSQFLDFLSEFKKEFDIYGPNETSKGFYDWVAIDQIEQFEIKQGLPKSSIKTFLFPQPEILFEFSANFKDPAAYRLKEPDFKEKKIILFGVRPCDARSISLNSMPYSEDTYFQKRLEQILVFGFLCKSVCSTCFCSWVGGSPVSMDGMDIAVFDLEDAYVLRPITKKGEELLNRAGLDEATDVEKEAFNRLVKENSNKNQSNTADILKSKDLFDLYNASFWQELSDACINCGTCTFLCPTCYCFDIQDEVLKGKGRRIRYWDSCMFPLFTLHASGHNPRGDKLKRVRNRFMHKLKYFPDRFGPISCVGCGRCIRECPVSIDIREVLRQMLET